MHCTRDVISCCHCLFCFLLPRKRILSGRTVVNFIFRTFLLTFRQLCSYKFRSYLFSLPKRLMHQCSTIQWWNKWKRNLTIKNRLVCKLSSLNCESIIRPSNQIIILSNMRRSDVNNAKPTETSALEATKNAYFHSFTIKMIW